ncbi:MAG: LacI family DNA-binding transcriptional regulator [Lentisphaeria bacterium]|nr:LacI family DNA-binding transcriptional regulator [Lentisphaeria bacterium]
MISLAEIAKRCGVSIITVSRALDPLNSAKVKPSTREKILEVCKKENFYPSFSARSLASGRTRSIGFIVPGIEVISTPQAGVYLRAFNEELEKNGYNLLLLPVNGSDWDVISSNAEPLILSGRCDSYVTVAFSVSVPPDRPVTMLQTTALQDIDAGSFPVVCISNSKAMRNMAEHLRKEGFGKPLFINFGKAVVERIKQWSTAFAEIGMGELAVLDLPEGSHLVSGDTAVFELLRKNQEYIKQFDIWVFSNDLWAMQAMEFLNEENLTPGKDVAVIGFDNIERNYTHPRIGTIKPPLTEFGRAAAKMALERIQFPDKDFSGIRVELESEALFRESCCRGWKNDKM